MTKTSGTQTPVISPRPAQQTGSLPLNPPNRLASTNPPPPESDLESESSFIAPDETLYERISALKDIIPASTRRSLTSKYETVSSWTKSGLLFGGKTLWVVSTSALLLGVPWALAYSEEQMIVEQERAEMMNQRAQNEVCVAGV